MRKFFTGVLILAALLQAVPALCETRSAYVSDLLILTFREGPGTQYKVLKSLPSNTPLTVIEEGEKYTKVELESGQQGWVNKQFIMFTPPKALQIKALEKDKQALEGQITALQKKLNTMGKEISSDQAEKMETAQNLSNELEQIRKQNIELTDQLAQARKRYTTLVSQSGNLQKIMDENNLLKGENDRITQEINVLKKENSSLFRTAMIKWALAGVGVLLLGWILGQSVATKRRGRGSLLD